MVKFHQLSRSLLPWMGGAELERIPRNPKSFLDSVLNLSMERTQGLLSPVVAIFYERYSQARTSSLPERIQEKF